MLILLIGSGVEAIQMRKVCRKWLVFVAWMVFASCFCMGDKAHAFSDCAGVGDLMYDVVNNCGAPTSVESGEKRMIGSGFVPFHTPDGWLRGPLIVTEIEEWTYNFGPTRFMRILRFENGILTSIRVGGYGY
jgi:hypothetical protein